jgi:hypothetical protein
MAALSCFSVEAINIKLLKGTHDIVPADYSPVMGVSFLEWGTAEQWYKLSARSQAAQLKEGLEKNSKVVSDNPELAKFAQEMESVKNSATENLIMSMFHIAGGTFNVTNADGNPVKYLEPKHVGKILQVVQKWSQASADQEKLAALQQESSAKKSDYEARIKTLQKETSLLNAKILAAKKASNNTEVERLQKELKLKAEELVKNQFLSKKIDLALKDFAKNSLQQELYDLCMSFAFKNEQSQQPFTEKNWNLFINSLVGSIQESIAEPQLYAKNTPEGILLGFMLKKSDTRDDLQNYFRGFKGDDIFVLPTDQEYGFTEINQILAAKTDASNFDQLADLLCAYTYQELYTARLPKMTSYTSVNYKGIRFSDCMDTTMRMLTNIVTYRADQHKFGIVPHGLHLNPVVENFYTSENGLCADSAEVGNSKVHQAWTDVIENVPGCVYAQIGTKVQDAKHVPSGFDGFIPVAQPFTITLSGKVEIEGVQYEPYFLQIGTKTYTLAQKKNVYNSYFYKIHYLLVPKSSDLFCCEMRANVLNIVIGLNHVFDLGLYSNLEQIFEPDFVSKNFGKICEKLDWKPQVNATELNNLKSMKILVETKSGEFFIHLDHNRHAYVSTKNPVKLDVQLEVSSLTKEATVAAIVGSGLKNIEQLLPKLQIAPLYKNVSVLEADKRFNVLGQMIIGKNSFNEVEKKYIQSLILSFYFVENSVYLENIVSFLGSKLNEAGLGDFILGALWLHDAEYKQNSTFKLLSSMMVSKIVSVEQGLSLVAKGVNDSYESVRLNAMSAINDFIDKKLITVDQVSQLLPLLEKGVNDLYVHVRINAMSAIESLINKDLITSDQVSQLLPLLEKGTRDSNYYIQDQAKSALERLVNRRVITQSESDRLVNKSLYERMKNLISKYFIK